MAEWTAEQVRELCEQRFEAQDRAVSAALAAQEKAVTAALGAAERAVLKAEAAAERRFESVNEFRATLSDQAGNLMPRLEAQVEFKALREKMDAIASRIERSEGRGAGLGAGWGYLVGAIGLIAALVALGARIFGH